MYACEYHASHTTAPVYRRALGVRHDEPLATLRRNGGVHGGRGDAEREMREMSMRMVDQPLDPRFHGVLIGDEIGPMAEPLRCATCGEPASPTGCEGVAALTCDDCGDPLCNECAESCDDCACVLCGDCICEWKNGDPLCDGCWDDRDNGD